MARSKRVSLNDIARAAGVSIAIASKVLNRGVAGIRVSAAVAARVQRIADDLGYEPNYPAQAMRRGSADVIAVTLDDDVPPAGPHNPTLLAHSYFGTLIGAMEACARGRGKLTTIIGPATGGPAHERALQGIRSRQFDGAVVLGTTLGDQLPALEDTAGDLPVVVVEPLAATRLASVDWDETAGLRLICQRLLELGHRDILWLGPSGSEAKRRGYDRRERRFAAIARPLGLRLRSCRYENPGPDTPDYVSATTDRAHAALLALLAGDGRLPTAIVCFNDMVGLGACSALAARGIAIPTTISVIGMDDIEGVYANPRLSSLSHGLREMGWAACELLCDLLTGTAASRHRTIQPVLVERASLGRARSD